MITAAVIFLKHTIISIQPSAISFPMFYSYLANASHIFYQGQLDLRGLSPFLLQEESSFLSRCEFFFWWERRTDGGKREEKEQRSWWFDEGNEDKQTLD